MQAVTATVNKTSDASTRAHNPDVMLRNRLLDRYPTTQQTRGATAGAAGAEFTPSAYLMLISRIDNALSKGSEDRAAVEHLSRLLSDKLATLSGRSRRKILALPELNALKLDNLSQLPALVRHDLTTAAEAGPALALLKAPEFVAAIKDETRTQTYGPRGLLRAS